MDPLVKALMEKYNMSEDLAGRVAVNLRGKKGAVSAYPKVAGDVRPPAPPPPPPAPIERDVFAELRAQYPADFHPEIDQLQRAYPSGRDAGHVYGDKGIEYEAQRRFEAQGRVREQPLTPEMLAFNRKMAARYAKEAANAKATLGTSVALQRELGLEAGAAAQLASQLHTQAIDEEEDWLLRAPGALNRPIPRPQEPRRLSKDDSVPWGAFRQVDGRIGGPLEEGVIRGMDDEYWNQHQQYRDDYFRWYANPNLGANGQR